MKLRNMLVAILMMITVASRSQTADFSNIKKVSLSNIAAIMNGNEVVGYYAFYFLDKAGKHENLYQLNILDNNLKITHSIELKKPDSYYLIEGAFNGDRFCFEFVSVKAKMVEYLIYDKNGVQKTSYTVKDLSDAEIQQYGGHMTDEENGTLGWLHSVPGKGFVRCGIEKEGGYRVAMQMFDNDGKKIWDANSGATSKKSFEAISPFLATTNLFITNISTREGMMSMNGETNTYGFDIPTGKQVFKISAVHAKGYLNVLGVSDAEGEVVVFGEYFGFNGSKKTMDVSNKIGFFACVYDEKGNMKREGFTTWGTDVAKFTKVSDKGKIDGNMNVMIHKFVKTANGNYYAIGEQFKKEVAIGSALMGGAAGKIVLYDMMVFEFNSSLVLTNVDFFDKQRTPVFLPKGYAVNGTATLGYVLKMFGWFDYVFTTQSADKSTFNSVYVNYDKSVDEGSSYVIGNISLTKAQKLVNTKVNLKTKPTSFIALPAKPGYIAVFEYYKKKKTASIHLEKLDI